MTMGNWLQAQGGDDCRLFRYPDLRARRAAHGRALGTVELVGQGRKRGGELAVMHMARVAGDGTALQVMGAQSVVVLAARLVNSVT